MKKIFILSFVLSLSYLGIAQQVTFSEHIAPIIYEHCTSCHRQGEIAPFPLTTYEEVAAWSGMIKYVTEIKYMPPWKPDPAYSHFVGESVLTNEQIQLIATWADEGAIQGDPSLEPPIPDFPTGSQLGTPDLVLKMEEVYHIKGNNKDDYRVFVLPTGLI
ncbi:MAG: cytochrome c, partial [Bacteroidota bacterium]